MDPAFLSATAALAGSVIGALASFATTWLTQATQLRVQTRAGEATKREALYADFLAEASRRLAEGMTSEAGSPDMLVGLFALVGRMRLVSTRAVVTAAEDVVRRVMDTYDAPVMSFHVLRERREAMGAELDVLATFGEACRTELLALRG